MNDRYGRDDRFDPRSRQASRESNWQDRESHDYDHPRQQQQWHDENRSYGESIQRNRGSGQMGGQQGSYGGGSQDFWHRDDDRWSSTESQGRSDYGSQRGGWQGGGMSGSARRSESQGNYGSQGYGSQGMRGSDRQESGRHEYGQRSMGGYGQSGYGQSNYGSRNAEFSSFTGNDYGGRDFSGGHSAYGSSYSGASQQGFGGRGGYAGSSDYRSGGYRGGVVGREYLGSDDGRDDRGILERAGDAIAGWFSDDDDYAHRRQMDHRGRGPSGYTRSDERIKEDANDHLTHDPSVDASNITVSVEGGEVTLNGTVSSRFAKRRAEDCVDHISGVKHVQNNLRVQDRMSGNQSGMGQSSSGQSATTARPTGATSAGASSTGAGSAGASTTGAASSAGSSATKSGSGSTAR